MRDVVPKMSKREIDNAIVRKSLKLNDTYRLDDVPTNKAEPIVQTEGHRHGYVTHTKHPLSFREARFIDAYMALGDGAKAVEEAGFTVKNKARKARVLLHKDYIIDEINYRQEIYAASQIADRQEILAFYTSVMRGQVKDQFDLDATLKDRLDAGEKLARRIIDVEDKRNVQAQQVVVNIDFNREDKPSEVIDIQQVSD